MSGRLRVTALTGGRNVPSARFRVEQLAPALRRDGVELEVRHARISSFPPSSRPLRPFWLAATLAARLPDIAATRRGQVTLLQREFVSSLATLERFTARPRVLDVDDAIWLNRGDGGFARRLAREVDVVVAGNVFLAEWFGAWCGRVEILPTAIDTDRFRPAVATPVLPGPRPPAIGWTGSSANFPYLMLWEDALRAVLSAVPDAKVLICADRRPPLDRLPADRWQWVPWTPAVEVPFLQSLDIGLMPLADTPWARGKCSYKMLQYLACGVPAVVSPVGMNNEVLAQDQVGIGACDADEAAAAMVGLLADPARCAALGLTGRALVERCYAIDIVAPRLGAILRDVAGANN
jgi:glycosyltransferase involved in cell wall biosynthesis